MMNSSTIKAKTISAHDFMLMYNKHDTNKSKALTIVDLRTDEEFATAHLQNTLHLPVQQLNDESFTKITTSDANNDEVKTIYLLCQSDKRAHMALDKLTPSHDKQLVVIDGGLNAIKSL